MERRFSCTACGKCCYGWLPLSLEDALKHAGRFPLAMILTPLRQGSRAFDLTARQGTTLELPKNKALAVQVSPVAYIPHTLACPELADDNRCAIHSDKPSRCRAMPFSPTREERDQSDLLVPKSGWLCDTSESAPVIYRDGVIIARDDYDLERRQILDQTTVLKSYADNLIVSAPNVVAGLQKAAAKKRGGYVVLKFTTVLPRLEGVDVSDFCRRQMPVLNVYAGITADDKKSVDYHGYYTECAAAMERLLARS